MNFLKKEWREMTAADFSHEYMCCFTGDGAEYFDRRLIENAVDETIPELRIERR
jgi:phage FluMu gp28-like protein